MLNKYLFRSILFLAVLSIFQMYPCPLKAEKWAPEFIENRDMPDWRFYNCGALGQYTNISFTKTERPRIVLGDSEGIRTITKKYERIVYSDNIFKYKLSGWTQSTDECDAIRIIYKAISINGYTHDQITYNSSKWPITTDNSFGLAFSSVNYYDFNGNYSSRIESKLVSNDYKYASYPNGFVRLSYSGSYILSETIFDSVDIVSGDETGQLFGVVWQGGSLKYFSINGFPTFNSEEKVWDYKGWEYIENLKLYRDVSAVNWEDIVSYDTPLVDGDYGDICLQPGKRLCYLFDKKLKYTFWDGTNWITESVDDSVNVKWFSMKIDSQDRVHVSYFDVDNKDLKYALRAVDGTWAINTIDEDGIVGMFNSLALDENDSPHISYIDNKENCVKYAYKIPYDSNNKAPIAKDDYCFAKRAPSEVYAFPLKNDSDPDGDQLEILSSSEYTVCNDDNDQGHISYVKLPHKTLQDEGSTKSFKYYVSDGKGGEAYAWIHVIFSDETKMGPEVISGAEDMEFKLWGDFFTSKPNEPLSADGDLDQDGVSNYDEFKYGTDPSNADSYFDFNLSVNNENKSVLSFNAVYGKEYRIESTEEGEFSLLENFFGTGSAYTRQIDEPLGLSDFFKVGIETFGCLGLEPKANDPDGDFLSTWFENEFLKTDPNKFDTDGDGISDYTEVALGLDPLKHEGNLLLEKVARSDGCALAGEIYSKYLKVRLSRTYNNPLFNNFQVEDRKPVTFSVSSGTGKIINPADDSDSDQLTLLTDAEGCVQVKYRLSNAAGGVDRIKATVGDGYTPALTGPVPEVFFKVYPINPELGANPPAPPVPVMGEPAVGGGGGQFTVSANGAATYSMPITVSKGVNGMAPRLSINYSSYGGNGAMGKGWSMGGYSVITRGSEVKFDSSDEFYLDGEKLIAITGEYGADGTEYRTHNNHFSKIVSYGRFGKGPAYFKVWRKSGLIQTFRVFEQDAMGGHGLEPMEGALSWQLYEVADRHGNWIRFAYEWEGGELTLSSEAIDKKTLVESRKRYIRNYNLKSVSYGSKDGTTEHVCGLVNFTYATRSDKTAKFVFGDNVGEQSLLDKIEVYRVNDGINVFLRKYQFSYEASPVSGQSRMTRIQESGTDGTRLPYIDFTYSKASDYVLTQWNRDDSFHPPEFLTGTLRFIDGANYDVPGVDVGARMIDLNNDGLPDFIRKGPQNTAYSDFKVYYQTTDPANRWVANATYPDLPQRFVEQVVADGKTYFEQKGGMVDKNNDGYPDFTYVDDLYYYHPDNTWSTSEPLLTPEFLASLSFSVDVAPQKNSEATDSSKPDSYISSSFLKVSRIPKFHVDLLNKGTVDVLPKNEPVDEDATGQEQEAYIDLNGDGKLTKVLASELATQLSDSAIDNTARFIDVNGDGLVDILTGRSLQHTAYLNTARGWYRYGNYASPVNFHGEGFKDAVRFIDINGDGLIDIMWATDTPSVQRKTWLNTGSGWKEADAVYHSPVALDKKGVMMFDVNGDGFADILESEVSVGKKCWLNGGSAPDLITAVTVERGAATTVTYKPLNGGSEVYTQGAKLAGVRNIQDNTMVVAACSTDNCIGGTSSTSYRYGGLRLIIEDKIPLGMEWMEETNEQTGIKTKTTYSQTRPYVTQPILIEKRLSDDTLIQSVATTWANKGYDAAQDIPYFLHASKTEEKTYELDGTQVSYVISTSEYDDFGNATKVTVDHNDGHNWSISNTYTNDEEKWLIGKVTKGVATHKATDVPDIVKTSSFTYDAVKGLLKSETVEPGSNMELTTTFDHDVYGNIISTTTTGTGIPTSRVAKASYSNDGRYLVMTENALGHKNYLGVDSTFDQPTWTMDANGLTSRIGYDQFGNQIYARRPDGVISTQTPSWPAGDAPPLTAYQVKTETSGQAPAITYFDKLGRPLRVETLSGDGRTVYQDKEYDARGWVKRTTRNYFPGDTVQWTNFDYDVKGRVVKTTLPDASEATTSYQGLVTVATNPLGQTHTTTKNAVGQVVKTKDHLNGEVTFKYNANGDLLETNSLGAITTLTYDLRGRRISMAEANSGKTEYTYNSLDELVQSKDAKDQVTAMKYDLLGRLLERTELEGTTTWTYDTATGKGVGQVASVDGLGCAETYKYDDLGRPVETVKNINSEDFNVKTSYDQYSRLETLTYPTGFQTKNVYNARGYLDSVTNPADATVYWKANENNADGAVIKETLGNGLETVRSFDPQWGFIKNIQTYPAATPATKIQDLSYQFNKLGTLTERQDVRQSLIEGFFYDGLNRLNNVKLNGADTLTLTYNANGNIAIKSDVGTYTYGENGAGAHAVTSTAGVKNNTYTYDANGNRLAGGGSSIIYSSYDKPLNIQIDSSSENSSFAYGPSRQLILKTHVKDGTTRTTSYLGSIYEKEVESGGANATKHTHYIRHAGGTIAIFTQSSADGDSTRYAHRDYLGSLTALSKEDGLVDVRFSYDAFGKRRNTDWTASNDPPASLASAFTDHGFTGHRHLDFSGLIHMKGRVCDPVLGRFLNVDALVQAPFNSQSYNRYSYCINNPLSFTDPSGWFFKKLFKSIGGVFNKLVNGAKTMAHFQKEILKLFGEQIKKAAKWTKENKKTLIVIAFSVAVSMAMPAAMPAVLSGAIGGAVAGGLSAHLYGGNSEDVYKAALSGGMQGAAFGAVGDLGHAAGWASGSPQKIIAHGLVGGAFSEKNGGKFKHGFLSAGFTQAASPRIGTFSSVGGRVAAAAVVGGIGTEIGGGKFKDGAMTGTYSQLFNEEGFHKSWFNDSDAEDLAKDLMTNEAKMKYYARQWDEGKKSGWTAENEYMQGYKANFDYYNGERKQYQRKLNKYNFIIRHNAQKHAHNALINQYLDYNWRTDSFNSPGIFSKYQYKDIVDYDMSRHKK